MRLLLLWYPKNRKENQKKNYIKKLSIKINYSGKKKKKNTTTKTKLKNKLFRKTEIITLKYKPKHKLLRKNRFFFQVNAIRFRS